MKNNMSKKLNIILVGMFCSASVMAQTDTLTAHRDNMAVDFGRNIVHDMKEVTGAVSVVAAERFLIKEVLIPAINCSEHCLAYKCCKTPVQRGRTVLPCIYGDWVLRTLKIRWCW